MVNSQPMPAHALSLGQFPTVISRNLNLSIIATGIMAFVGILTETMTNVLLPVLMGLFTVSTATVQWLTTGYLLMVAVVISVSSYCNRRFTNRATFIIAMVLCIAALAAIAPTLHADSNAVFNTLQQLGGVVGTTVMALCLSTCSSAMARSVRGITWRPPSKAANGRSSSSPCSCSSPFSPTCALSSTNVARMYACAERAVRPR